MKNAPELKGGAAPVGAPVMTRATQRQPVTARRAGDRYTDTILGQAVTFTLMRIPHAEIEQRTRVWAGNERDQELLTPSALADLLPSFEAEGQQVPAYGRPIDGNQVETADGSRRRRAARLTGSDYLIWAGKLTDAQMAYLSTIGNTYRETSAWERGKSYQQDLDEDKYPSVNAMSEARRIDRKTMTRCLDTARLPREIIKLYPHPGALSGRAGQKLAKAMNEAMLQAVDPLAKQALTDADEITAHLLAAAQPVPAKPIAPARTWSDSSLRIERNGQGTTIQLADDVPAELCEKIEKLIRKELGIKA